MIFQGLFAIIQQLYGDVSKWGRLRALPVADTASNKEWQRSKFCERNANKEFQAPQQDITDMTRKALHLMELS